MGDANDNVVPFPQPAGRLRRADPELRRALGDLRREIDDRFGPAAREEREESFDWVELFDELRHRLGNLGVVERSGEVDEFGLDLLTLMRSTALLDFLVDRYWRVELHGADTLPVDGPVLFVANRAGLLPWDGLVFAHRLQRDRPTWPRTRFLVADWLITLPFVQPYLSRLGGVRACRENAERLLEAGHFVVVFPEGVKGAAKVFRDRYRLQRFGRGGVIRVALETGVPLVPVGVVGAEEAHPVLFKWTPPGRPLPFVPVTPTFPLLGPLGALPLPSKWMIRIGAPVELSQLGPEALRDELLLSRLTEDLRAEIQALVDAGLHEREGVWS
jgi:1-acyl-sn-glycerol-3-phosphate acyltransferase